jgi:hypothetical protein
VARPLGLHAQLAFPGAGRGQRFGGDPRVHQELSDRIGALLAERDVHGFLARRIRMAGNLHGAARVAAQQVLQTDGQSREIGLMLRGQGGAVEGEAVERAGAEEAGRQRWWP